MKKYSNPNPSRNWRGSKSFYAKSDREAVLVQIKIICRFDNTKECKLDILLNQLRSVGIKNPKKLVVKLAEEGAITLSMVHNKMYVALVYPEGEPWKGGCCSSCWFATQKKCECRCDGAHHMEGWEKRVIYV